MAEAGSALEVVAVYGAATPPGRLALALDTTVERIAALGQASVARISLYETPLGIAGARALEQQDSATQAAVDAVVRAAAVLIASPVYRASLPGVLKNLLDLLPVEALRSKPVGLVVVGATNHHFLGVERHVRDILSWFGALPLPVSVYLTSTDFGETGLSDAATADLGDLATTLVHVAGALRGTEMGPPPLAERHG